MALKVRCTRWQSAAILEVWPLLPSGADTAWLQIDAVVRALIRNGTRALPFNSEQISDCAQQVHLDLVRRTRTHSVQQVLSPAAFVARVVHDKIVDVYRRFPRGVCKPLEHAADFPDMAAVGCQQDADAKFDLLSLMEHAHATDGFTRKDYHVVAMCCMCRMPRMQVANMLCPPSDGRQMQRLEKRLSRALEKLRIAARSATPHQRASRRK